MFSGGLRSVHDLSLNLNYKLMEEEKEYVTGEKEISNLQKKVSRIENIFWVIAVVAAIFGISGAYGLRLLSKANSEIQALQTKVVHFADTVRKYQEKSTEVIRSAEREATAAIASQERASTKAVLEAGTPSLAILKGRLDHLGIKISNIRTLGCANPSSGTTSTCRCDENEIMVAVQHHDIKSDGVDAEKVVGILCAQLKLASSTAAGRQ